MRSSSILAVLFFGTCMAFGILGDRSNAGSDDADENTQSPKEAAFPQDLYLRIVNVAELQNDPHPYPYHATRNRRLLQLTVQPWHAGKISRDTLDFYQMHETQQFNILFRATPDAVIRAGDHLTYRCVEYERSRETPSNVPPPLKAEAMKPEGKEIYTKRWDDVGDVIVYRELSLSTDEMPGVLKKDGVDKQDSFFNVRVDLRLKNAKSITLATLLVNEAKAFEGYEVLNLLIDKGRIVMAVAENGRIKLVQIQPGSSAPVLSCELTDWTAAPPDVSLRSSKVRVGLGLLKDRRLEASVQELRPDYQRVTEFVQHATTEWVFDRVKPNGSN